MENKVADALLRVFKEADAGECNSITTQQPLWVQELIKSYQRDEKIQAYVAQALSHQNLYFTYRGGILRYKGRIVVGETRNFRGTILQEVYGSTEGGHLGFMVFY